MVAHIDVHSSGHSGGVRNVGSLLFVCMIQARKVRGEEELSE